MTLIEFKNTNSIIAGIIVSLLLLLYSIKELKDAYRILKSFASINLSNDSLKKEIIELIKCLGASGLALGIVYMIINVTFSMFHSIIFDHNRIKILYTWPRSNVEIKHENCQFAELITSPGGRTKLVLKAHDQIYTSYNIKSPDYINDTNKALVDFGWNLKQSKNSDKINESH
jgi:hypothetical protein